jgi:hypothetical protein
MKELFPERFLSVILVVQMHLELAVSFLAKISHQVNALFRIFIDRIEKGILGRDPGRVLVIAGQGLVSHNELPCPLDLLVPGYALPPRLKMVHDTEDDVLGPRCVLEPGALRRLAEVIP